jgi:hypothetical protein
MLRQFSFVGLVTISLMALVSFVSPSYSQTPSGTIRIVIVSGGFIVGAAGGSGTLTYQGKKYPLRIAGLSLGATIGASKTELIGNVYNLSNASDIAGTYTAASAGLALAGGGQAAKLKNSNGVVLQVKGRKIGLEAKLDLSGMDISLK